jgi:hypothetical protein
MPQITPITLISIIYISVIRGDEVFIFLFAALLVKLNLKPGTFDLSQL